MPKENYLTCNYYNAYIYIQKKGVQTYFPKVVKSFGTVASQTDNNIAINILNSKKVHLKA